MSGHTPLTPDHLSRTIENYFAERQTEVLPSGEQTKGRYGDLELETDDGDRVSGKDIGRRMAKDWDLDLDEIRPHHALMATQNREPPKLVHRLVFSMPVGTPAIGLVAATRDFLREEFAGKYRYAFVLHEDRPQPHVHVVVRAVRGCNIPLFVSGHTLIEPIDRNQLDASFRWINQFDPDDALGWPLRQLSPPYAALVEDFQVNALGNSPFQWLKSFTPYSHTQYWGTPRVLDRIEAALRDLLG